MTDRSLATSADYADALLVARRAKNWLFLLVLLMLLGQIAIFFVARYTDLIAVASRGWGSGAAASVEAERVEVGATQPTTVAVGDAVGSTAAEPVVKPVAQPAARDVLRYVSGLVQFMGTILPMLLAAVLLLIVNIMLVGRLIGVSRVTSAFVCCLLLILLMFPWQIYFGGRPDAGDFRVPGVLYTWHDLYSNAKFATSDMKLAVVKWARFLVMPLIALVLLLMIQIKSNRGLRQALGEENPEIQITT